MVRVHRVQRKAQLTISDALWSQIEPLLPQSKPRRFLYPGRKPLHDRAVLTGILFVLQSGISWQRLPQELDCGSGMSCWRRLRDWQAAGVWDQMKAVLLTELPDADHIEWSRASVAAFPIRAEESGPVVRAPL